MYVVGIDIGSLSTETLILNEHKVIVTYNILPTGSISKNAAENSFNHALENSEHSKDDISFIVSTGYGREIVHFADLNVTEITCHGRGAHFLFPDTRTVVDIGGQDSKVIKVNSQGKVTNFVMNDKCAAGTGRFLEVMAKALEVDLDEMGKLSLTSKNNLSISSMCTVFAESEVVSLIASGHAKEDILNGLNKAISDRIVSLIGRVGLEEKIAMTGGVAKNIGVVKSIEKKIGTKLNIPQEPQIVGALGAALIALERV